MFNVNSQIVINYSYSIRVKVINAKTGTPWTYGDVPNLMNLREAVYDRLILDGYDFPEE